MKKRLMVLLVLLCLGISGCQRAEADSAVGDGMEAGTGSGLVSGLPERPSGTPQTETKTQEQIQSELLKRLYKADGTNKGAYLLPVELGESSYIIRMECFQNKLLILMGGSGLDVQLFDLDQGKIINSINYDVGYEDMGEGGFLEDGSIWIFVPARETLYYLSLELEMIDSVELDVLYRSAWYSDYDEDILWTMDYEKEMLYYYMVKTQEEKEYSLQALLEEQKDSEGSWWSLDKAGGGFAYLTVTTDFHRLDRYRFSALTRQLTSDLLANTSAMSGGESGSFYQFHDKYRIIDFSEPNQVIGLEGINEKEQLIFYQDQYLFSGVENKLYIYDCSRGLCYTGYEGDLPEEEGELWNYVTTAAARPDTRQILFSIMSPQEQKIILCDLEMFTEPRRAAVTRSDVEQVRTQYDKNNQYIEQEYEIQMLTLEEAWEKDDMSGYILWDNVGILDLLDASEMLKEFLDELPSGMVYEMLESRGGDVEICFSGTISGDESSGNLSYAGAYVTTCFYDDNGESAFFTRMAADVSLKSMLQTNFAHEWFHLLEDHIWDCEMETCWSGEETEGEALSPGGKARKELLENWENQWIGISPEDGYFYEYNESLAYDEEKGIYVYVNEADVDDVYFIDAYSRTFPKEDRARIFEHLYMAGLTGEEFPWGFESVHIRQKAVYLCQLLRSCYPSVDTPEKNIWEQGLCSEDWNLILENRDQRLKQF